MSLPPIPSIRNIGIISHIDAGKTTVSERILYYAGEIHRMGEVHEGDTVMDWMPQEQERGITITATSTACRWKDTWINLIDTPGHIDFTIEVERSLRVLDGAIAIFSAVEGVQPQSESVWRQADRHRVPRICFINKMDRIGSDLDKTLADISGKLGARAALLQLPIGNETGFRGVIDLIGRRAVYFEEADRGATVTVRPVPDEMAEMVDAARNRLTEMAADYDDSILVDFLDGGEIADERLIRAIRKGTLECRLFPVLLGSALRNKGIQPLLDAVASLLPSPLESATPVCMESHSGQSLPLPCDANGPLCLLAFKVLADEGRKLTYLRVYSGTLKNGAALFNSSRGCFEKTARLFRMHAHKREPIDSAAAGDIVAATGLKESLTGDTLCDPMRRIVLEGVTAPEPVVSLAVEPKGIEDREKLPGALEKLLWEDPSFRVREDEDTGQTILTGMGELHLEIVTDRLERNFGIRVNTGRPQVVFRETLLRAVERREIFRSEMEGKIQGGEVLLRLTPLARGAGISIVVPPDAAAQLNPQLREALAESLLQGCEAGCASGYPLTDIEARILEAPFQPGYTSEMGLRAAVRRGLILAAREAAPTLLEPVMALEVTTPAENAGRVLGSLQQKRGRVEGIVSQTGVEIIRARVPLTEMFGYMTELRGATKGRGVYTMEFAAYEQAPPETLARFGLGAPVPQPR